ncbi:hypothetical protein V8C35DRAFT_310874, partial [Trichoderma chlorosporum]
MSLSLLLLVFGPTSAPEPEPDGGPTTTTLEVEEMPEPMPSSWRAYRGSGEPIAGARMGCHWQGTGGREARLKSRPVEVPLRTNQAGRRRIVSWVLC